MVVKIKKVIVIFLLLFASFSIAQSIDNDANSLIIPNDCHETWLTQQSGLFKDITYGFCEFSASFIEFGGVKSVMLVFGLLAIFLIIIAGLLVINKAQDSGTSFFLLISVLVIVIVIILKILNVF